MAAKQLSSYDDKKDKNGVKVSSWAEQVMPGIALCKTCVPNRRISFKKGKGDLFNHSESDVHVKSMKGDVAKPGGIDFFLEGHHNEADSDVKKQANYLEIAVVTFLSRHQLGPNHVCVILSHRRDT